MPTRGVLEEVLLQEAEKLCLQNPRPGRVVYEQDTVSPYVSVALYLTKKLNGGFKSDTSVPYYLPESIDDTTLIFESRFESGNISKAIQM